MALPQGFEPRFQPSEGCVLSITLWEHRITAKKWEKLRGRFGGVNVNLDAGRGTPE